MNKVATSTISREIVWEVNTNIKETQSKMKKNSKEPVLVKTLIEKTFQRLSTQLLDRLTNLEVELRDLQAENAKLKDKLSQVSP